ncbi:WD40 repeat-like protein [Rhizoclosmatium globosum]|uniref:WD40 repeat-like protein n=1 Tax=Rhizoclosmatium globosum TaxID=329046 RepID=A0A1Y2C354_9FUNG|nr:WD40 repeat-like protein [Rhizoclosmatium globosum]|eukprot:ORY40745.1 WD40 repeat-like protein [Rhizoclosmatium globosum]
MTPRIGQGLATMTNKQDEKEDQEDDKKKEEVWKHEKNVEEIPIGDDDLLGSYDELHQKREADGLIVKKNDALAVGERSDSQDQGATPQTPQPPTTTHSSRASTPASETDNKKSGSGITPLPGGQTPPKGFEFNSNSGSSINPPPPRRGLLQDGPTEYDIKLGMQRDVLLCYAAVNRSLDYLLVCASNVILCLALAEVLNLKDVHSKFMTISHDLSSEFVSNSLKTVWDLLNRELPSITLHDLRDPPSLRASMKQIIEIGRTSPTKNPRGKLKALARKMELVHDLFTACDIFLFPNFVAAHKEGVKSCQYSAFDSSLWLSGGYDCLIRIHDLRASNNHICLSQYAGHKSVITDVHFTKDDTHIVSSSFDRTIKIWNSQSASCERTLTGHTDSVMSCDVTVDRKYVVSGSMDGTVRLWDFDKGSCVAVIKKHTRWVKVVRFSPDGRFIVSAGLDHKIYIWDIKFVANSRVYSPKRTIEDHRDYILDVALARPNYILTTSRDSFIRMFDINTGNELYKVSLAPSWACTVSFSPNGEYFATGSFDNNVIIFNTKDGSVVRRIRVLNLGIMSVRFPKDLSYVCVGTQEGFVQQIPL